MVGQGIREVFLQRFLTLNVDHSTTGLLIYIYCLVYCMHIYLLMNPQKLIKKLVCSNVKTYHISNTFS